MILQAFILLIVVAVLMFLINIYIPMNTTIKAILNIIVVVLFFLYVLTALGIFDPTPGYKLVQY
jgi:hypothetical protein